MTKYLGMEGMANSQPAPRNEKLNAASFDSASHHPAVQDAMKVHNQTVSAAASFHDLFSERNKDGKDPSDHYEQDLLRAMLLFASSGLDAAIKQLVRDSLENVIEVDSGAQSEFAKFIERRLKRNSLEDGEKPFAQGGMDYRLLATALASAEPRRSLISALVQALTDDSLQSRDQLLKVATHFALTRDEVLKDDPTTKAAFQARNQLAHEMDIDFKAGARRNRTYGEMVLWSENILSVGSTFISAVSSKLSQKGDLGQDSGRKGVRFSARLGGQEAS